MPKESVLTQKEKDSFEIEKFIFHIIVQESIVPIFLDEITLDADQVDFFKKRFTEVSEGIQHIFKDSANSNFYSLCASLLEDPDKSFLDVSKKLTTSFKDHHKKNMTDGVFITALVKVEGERKLIFLLKLDHRKVYEYLISGNKALLHEIKQTFVEDRKAIQKSALVDISDHYSWDVLATDRTATGRTAIREYFADFLTVVEKETPSKLTQMALSSVFNWAVTNKKLLDPKQEISSYKARALAYLVGTPKFKTKSFIDAIVEDSNESRGDSLKLLLKSHLDEVGLSGQSFKPAPGSLSGVAKRNVRETAEGVKIQWEGDPRDSNIEIPKTRNKNDNLYHILIKTSDIFISDKD